MNCWFCLQVITGIFQNYPPIMWSFCFNLSAMFTPSLLSTACQYANEFESALFSYFIWCVYNVFKPLGLFTWKFLSRLGNWKFKSLILAVLEGDAYHDQWQKLYNKENNSKHLVWKALSDVSPGNKLFPLSLHHHVYVEGADLVLIVWK